MIHVVDTHALLWFLDSDRRLSARARGAMEDRSGRMIVPTIALAEIWHLCQRRRITPKFEDILSDSALIPNLEYAPLDVGLFPFLPAGFELHDAVVVATARQFAAGAKESVAIVTKDPDITEKSGLTVIW